MRVAPGPGLNRLKSKKSTCVPLKTLKLKVLVYSGRRVQTDLYCQIASRHLEVLHAVKPKIFSPVEVITDSLCSPKNVPA